MEGPALNALPKAVLHDHLDGGVRVPTILELADEQGYTALPASDVEGLRAWFHQGRSGSLERYLRAFVHTVGVLQTREALERVAGEFVADLAADGVVYAEIRFGPSLHLRAGLKREDAIEAVLSGATKAGSEHGVMVGVIASALRQDHDSEDVARAAAHFAGEGIVGFDLAGPEAGYPADDHIPAFTIARHAGLGVTVHAGESDGPHSIWRAVARASARRIGHGVRIVEDTVMRNGEIVELGSLARMVRDLRIPLEICIVSNVHTGIADSTATHPFGALYRAGFRVTLNTDNRLMSDTTLTNEFTLALEHHGLTVAGLGEITIAALESGFGDWPERHRLINEVVRPTYAAAEGQPAT